ncbi:MAG: hypothetical protein HRT90_06055 [Candidatus Margulisbacteria bacterium]|nr:hypothetical protein [Candidatus Margulisiibacteriota bacterium]
MSDSKPKTTKKEPNKSYEMEWSDTNNKDFVEALGQFFSEGEKQYTITNRFNKNTEKNKYYELFVYPEKVVLTEHQETQTNLSTVDLKKNSFSYNDKPVDDPFLTSINSKINKIVSDLNKSNASAYKK